MEVLGNSSQLKKSEDQNSEINYNCHLSKQVNSGAKGKGEADINLLVACKVQLSSEVIRWKTETLRLQKERDSAQLQSNELDQMVVKLRERTRELEDRLILAEDKYKHLKSTSFNAEKDKAFLVQRLNLDSNKCSSLESSIKSDGSRLQTLDSRKFQILPQEDWREVSQKMLQQMKNEMKELQEMSVHYHASEKENIPDTSGEVNADSNEIKLELSNLLYEAQLMKQQFLEQRQKLESILQTVISCDFPMQDWTSQNKAQDTDTLYTDLQNLVPSNPRRMSAEDYRLHFSKQLENTSDAKKMARKVQHFLKNPDLCVLPKDSTIPTEELKSSDYIPDDVEKAVEVEESEKVCPICQITFRASISQADFEEHVVNHLERESASLLDQYVIV